MKMSKIVRLSVLLGCVLGGSEFAQAASSVKLNWSIPATREDGRALAVSELSGYELYYTTDDASVTGTVKVSGGTTATYTVPNLVAGNYHFAIAAIDASGVKSKLSPVADVKVVVSTAAPSVPTAASAVFLSTATGTGKSIKASWIAPTTRVDGATLTASELQGYIVNLRSVFGSWALNATVSSDVSSYVIPNIESGFYAVEMAAIDKTGKQSASAYQLVYLR